MESNADLAAFLATGCERLGVPGCAVGVIAGGRHVVTCHGVTDVRHPRAVDADTLFPIGSTTKTLTATALMSLVHDGSLSLDDPVVRHLPDFAPADPAVRDVVTVGQLFDHTAGWRGDIEADTGWGEDAIELAVREVLPRARQVFPPGATASYNNLSLVVAGRLLERVTGTSYEAVIRARVLEPLGMSATYFFPWEVATRPIATGHVPGDDGLAPAYTWPIPRGMNPAGGAISSVRDQLAYAQFHLDGHAAGTAPVSDQLRVAMQQPRVAMPSMLTGVGLSWLLKDRDGLRLVTHGGNCSNLFVSAFAIAPDEGFAVTVLTNSRGGTPLGASVTDWAIEHYLGRTRLPGHPAAADRRPHRRVRRPLRRRRLGLARDDRRRAPLRRHGPHRDPTGHARGGARRVPPAADRGRAGRAGRARTRGGARAVRRRLRA